jgi:hypothetical protein
MHSGELVVTGTDHINIDLSECPDRVVVHFIDKPVIVPCNPHHRDDLGWHIFKEKNIHHHHHHYTSKRILRITWKVTGTRKIGWKIYF